MLTLDEKKIRKGKPLGLPYQGSKKKISKKIIEIIKQNFGTDKLIYDIFGGGGATHLNQNQGLIIELLLDLASHYGRSFKAVQSKTYSDIPYLPTIDGKNGNEICVRDLDCITNIL